MMSNRDSLDGTADTPQGVRQRPWREYLLLVLAGVAGYEMKKPFGLLLHRVMGISDVHVNFLSSLAGNQAFQIIVCAGLASMVHGQTGLPAAPWLEKTLFGMHKERKVRVWVPGLLGLFASVLVVGAIRLMGSHFGIAAPVTSKLDVSGLSRAVAGKMAMLYPQTAVGAGLSEEILFRFGLLTIFAWIALVTLPKSRRFRRTGLWVAILVQALLFGYAHVSEGLMQLPLGGVATQVAIAPETWVGVVYGCLFVEYGLEAAIIAHASGDFINVGMLVTLALRHAHG